MTVKHWAPARGDDPDFDAYFDTAWSTIQSSGATLDDPFYRSIREYADAGSVSLEKAARELLARAYVKHGGRTFEVPYQTMPDLDPLPDNQGADVVLTVPVVPDVPYWYEDPDEAAFIEHYVLSRRALGPRLKGGLLITGPSGQGKTLGVSRAIERINERHGLAIQLLVMDCATVTDPQKWFGARHIGEKGDSYEESAFVTAVRNGWAILLDEAWRIHPHIGNSVMSILAGHERVTLSDLNITIDRHPQTVFLGTANIGSVFGGNHRQDYAMEERWPFRLERGFPPPLAEIDILTKNWGISADAAGHLVAIANATRRMWESGDVRVPISTRTLDGAAFLVASGMTEREALTRTALGLYDDNADGSIGTESDREKVRQAIDGKMRR